MSRTDWSAEAFPWLFVREGRIGTAPAVIKGLRSSHKLAFEVHVSNIQRYATDLALRKARETHGLNLFGVRAVDAMRLEKRLLHWKADILMEFDPLETGIERFAQMDKPNFVGRSALEVRRAASKRRRVVTLEIKSQRLPAHSDASVSWGGCWNGNLRRG